MDSDRKDQPRNASLARASEVDPTSPWPHLFLGIDVMEKEQVGDRSSRIRERARAGDPDTGYFMIHAVLLASAIYHPAAGTEAGRIGRGNAVSRRRPDRRPSTGTTPAGYDLLGEPPPRQTGNAGAASSPAARKPYELAAASYLN